MKTTPNRPGYLYQTNQPYPPGQPDQPEQPQPTHMTKWVLLPMRLFLGITFIYAGIQKLTDPQFFNPAARGYIGKQIIGFATNTPLHDILIRLVPHATLVGALVAYGEVAIGLGALLGLLFRPAAFFGILINVMFFLSATWHVYPYFYGSDIVFIFCWLTLLISGPVNTGLPSVDEWFIQRVLSDDTHYASVIAFLLGIQPPSAPLPAPATANQGQSRQGMGNKRPSQQNRYAQVQRAQQQSRRNFLWGMLTGGAGIVVLSWLGNVLHVFPGSATDSGSPNAGTPSSSATPPASGTPSSSATATTSGSPGSTVIAQVNAVQNNSSVNFTLASNGDPGVLVRLNNGQFVAYDATCTHAGCPVSYDPGSQLFQCPCHGAVFDPAKGGAVIQGPAQTPLTQVPIQVNNKTGAITTNQ